MADRTIEREASRHVIRIRRSFVIRNMTGIAIGGCGGETRAVVTLVALKRCVSTREREGSLRVIEHSAGPIGG